VEIIEKVREMIAGYLEENGIELIDVIYRREQLGMVLRLLVDTPEGITVKECEDLNKYLSGLLDADDIVNERYVLEVSSPGLDRPIVTDRDFKRSLGKELDITTYEAIDFKKTHEGILIGMDKENIVIEANGTSTVIPKNKIAKAKLKIKFLKE
jgi:ribosome maturation factor RimP